MGNTFTSNGGEQPEHERSYDRPETGEPTTASDVAVGSQQGARDGYLRELEHQRKYNPATALSLGFRPCKDGDGCVTGFQIVFEKSLSDDNSAGDAAVGGVSGRIVSGIESGIAEERKGARQLTEGVSQVQWVHLADYQREMTKVQEEAAADEKFRQLAEDLKKSGDFVMGGKSSAKIDAAEIESALAMPKPIMPVVHDLPIPPRPLPRPILPVPHDNVTSAPLPKPIIPVAHEVPNPQPLPRSIPSLAALPTLEPMALSQREAVSLPEVTPRQLVSSLPENMLVQTIHLATSDAMPVLPMQSRSPEPATTAPAPLKIESTRSTRPSPVPIDHNYRRTDSPPPPAPIRAKSVDVVEPMIVPVVTAPVEPVRNRAQSVEPPHPVRSASMPLPIDIAPSVPRESASAIEEPHAKKANATESTRVFSIAVEDSHMIQQAPAKPYASIYSLPAADRVRLIGAAENHGLKRTLHAGVSDHSQMRPVLSGGAEQSGHLERAMYGHYACSNGKDSFEMNLTLPPGASKDGAISTTVGGFLNVNRQRVVSSTQLDGRIVTDANGTRYEGRLATYTGGRLRFTAERVVITFRPK
ncbi:MAG: hypothetical protein K2W95_36210 [Candidatus Obscuribacterales bacterium]|nr:hypothetical protein [Candidatus Obscuribacterales bacterium]